MPDTLQNHIKAIVSGAVLGRQAMEDCFDAILSGAASPTQMAAILTALAMRGETAQDIIAGATILRHRATPITAPSTAMDIVGTGGDGIGTLNISTATAFVVAGAGVAVAKHGNKAVSSKSGAADVLHQLGINLDAPMGLVERALGEANICFLMAPHHHSAMRHCAPVRAELGFRTIFNLLGPLSNPAQVKRIMVGVFAHKWVVPFAEALRTLGTSHAIVVHGTDGLDEVTTTGVTHAALLRDKTITEMTITPSDAGVETAKPEALIGGTPAQNAEALKSVLDGERGAFRDIVILNTAVALFGGGHADSIAEGAERATAALDSGKARLALDNLIRITNGGEG